MKLLCKFFGHKLKFLKKEFILFNVTDHYYKCNRCEYTIIYIERIQNRETTET